MKKLSFDDIEQHPLHDLMAARYDNADAAFALNIPNFTDFRKAGERKSKGGEGYFYLPRDEENPVRPTYRLANIYEYALHKEISRSKSKEVAGLVNHSMFKEMRHRAGDRLDNYDDEVRVAVYHNYSFHDDPEDSRHTLGLLVDYPWVGFDPAVLDRSDERLKNPLFWVIAPDITADEERIECKLKTCDGTVALVEALNSLNALWSGAYYKAGDNFHSAITVNVTSVLKSVDDRLRVRLRGRRLKGGSM